MLIVLVGTSLPITRVILSTDDYNVLLLPFALSLMCLLLWEPTCEMCTSSLRVGIGAGILLCLSTVSASFILRSANTPHGWHGTIHTLFGAPLLTAAIILAGISVWKLCSPSQTERPIGATLAHMGIAMLLLGTLLSGYGTQTVECYLPKGYEYPIWGHLIYTQHVTSETPTRTSVDLLVDQRQAIAVIENNTLFRTELRQASIHHRLGYDLYITPMAALPHSITTQKGTIPAGALLAISLRPGISVVWLGMLLIAAGILTSLIQRPKTAFQLCKAPTSQVTTAN